MLRIDRLPLGEIRPRPGGVGGPDAWFQLDAVVTLLQSWIADGPGVDSIAVMAPGRYQRDRVTARLVEQGVPARAVDREKPPSDKVLVMTMHRAKGM